MVFVWAGWRPCHGIHVLVMDQVIHVITAITRPCNGRVMECNGRIMECDLHVMHVITCIQVT